MLGTAPQDVSTSRRKPQRLLLVEDDTVARLQMARAIRETGATVVTARDGEEALRYLLQQRFDVLLTDLRMPVMDGFDLIAALNDLPPSHRPGRVVAISGVYESGALRGAAEVAFLQKPFNLETLLETLGGRPN
jgi:CheY-like chemotaxis protein